MMALMIDYKEFLADSPTLGASACPISDLESEQDLPDLRRTWAEIQGEITAIYHSIDASIMSLVTGDISFEEYVDAKMAMLVGEDDMRKLAAEAAANAASQPNSSHPNNRSTNIIDPSEVSRDSDPGPAPIGPEGQRGKVAPIGPEGQIILRPHVSALMVMVNTIGVNAVNPRSIFTTEIVLGGGETVVVHEPFIEVSMKVRSTMASLMAAQQKHATRASLALDGSTPRWAR